jgi:hypothetical protein
LPILFAMPLLSQTDSHTDASFLDATARATARFRLPLPSAQVFDCLRNLRCLACWWPQARDIVALPPGLYGTGDVAVLKLRGENVVVLVIAYKPGRRIVLALRKERSRLLLDLRVRADASSTTLELALDTPRAQSFIAQSVQQLRLRLLCREAATRLERHLRASLLPAHPSPHDPELQ